MSLKALVRIFVCTKPEDRMAEIRLSKLIKQFCVGLDTLVDFLNTQGAGIESANPNMKVSDEYLPALHKRFGKAAPVNQPSAVDEEDEIEIIEWDALADISPISDVKETTTTEKESDSIIDAAKTEQMPVKAGVSPVKPKELVTQQHFDTSDRKAKLAAKESLLEELKYLVEFPGKMKEAFSKFRDIQNRWRETGPVPDSYFPYINDTYQFYVTKFYDLVVAERENRILDFKANFEAKTKLCEIAEELANSNDFETAYSELQKLHEQWKEIGPVAREYQEPLWNRFRAATIEINQKYRHFRKTKNRR